MFWNCFGMLLVGAIFCIRSHFFPPPKKEKLPPNSLHVCLCFFVVGYGGPKESSQFQCLDV